MDEYWTDIFQGLHLAGTGLQQAITGLQQAADNARHAHAEHGDIRETLARLETLILAQNERELAQNTQIAAQNEQIAAQTEEIRALRARLDQGE